MRLPPGVFWFHHKISRPQEPPVERQPQTLLCHTPGIKATLPDRADRQSGPAPEHSSNLARHLNTLAGLVSGIIGSKKTNLPAIASKTPDGKKRESRSKRFARFLQNPKVTPEAFFLPYAQALIESLPPGPLILPADPPR